MFGDQLKKALDHKAQNSKNITLAKFVKNKRNKDFVKQKKTLFEL